MKALGILILAVAAGFLAYRFAYDPIVVDLLGWQKAKEETYTPPPVVVVTETPMPVVEKPAPEPVAPKPEPVQPKPVMVPTVGLGKSVPKADADGFEPPDHPPLEQVVKNWREVPAKAFPRPVKLMKPVEFTMSIGKSLVGAGGTATAIAQEGDMLIVAPTPTSMAKSKIAMDDTDLKATLTAAYENWKVQDTAFRKRRWQLAKMAASNPQPVAASSGPINNNKPEKNADGQYAILLDSMKSGQVTEVTPQNITKWGDPQPEIIDGKNQWVIVVDYITKTMFGDFPTAAKAFVYNARVDKWVYKESGEVVP